MIKLENISVTFKQNNKLFNAVDNVNLTINQGDIYGIVGYSGAGKSTLVRTINLLQRPTQGVVKVADVNLMALTPVELRQERKKIGMIFQHFNLMNSLTVFDNIAFLLKHSKLSKEQIKNKVTELAELVGLSDKLKSYPRQLSGGQKQRVAIARALANDPKILLCDEATSALDPKTTYSILELLKKVNVQLGITIVIITHEMQVVKEICNRVAVMENGKVLEEGNILQIFTTPKEQITKDFIDTATHTNQGIQTALEHPELLNLQSGDILAKISFVGKTTGKPIISQLAMQYQVASNILFADIEIIQKTPVGVLLVVLSGNQEKLNVALKAIEESQVSIEIIKDLRKEVE